MAEILIVDDIPANIQLLIELLEPTNHTLRPTTNSKFALTSAIASPPDIILLDVNMPDMNGFEFCRILKQEPSPLSDIPVIFISARNDTESIVEGFKVGGADYISKPFNGDEVLARVATQLQLQQQRVEIKALHQQEIAQLTKLNQLKDEVLRIASHDLRGPLSIIHACGELLHEDSSHWNEENQELVEQILRSVRDMDVFLHDLLDTVYAEGQITLQFTTVEATSYLQTIFAKNMLLASQKDIALNFVTEADELVHIYVDQRRFEQVIQNLLSNAIKYTPSGGTVSLGLTDDAAETVIYVQDTGIGIPAEALPHLFDKFYRVDSKQHLQENGTGLGLAIAKALVEQNNGRISVTSTEGAGSIFTIALPRHTAE